MVCISWFAKQDTSARRPLHGGKAMAGVEEDCPNEKSCSLEQYKTGYRLRAIDSTVHPAFSLQLNTVFEMPDALTVKIIVGGEDLKVVRESGFNLCLTRDVKYGGSEEKGNVVFSMVPNEKLGPNMTLKWQEKYQVYETISFEGGAKVDVGTKVADIEGGESVDFDENGDYYISGTSKPGAPFSVRNGWQNPACIGVNNYDATTGSFASIFISPRLPKNSTSDLLPIKKFSVFWDLRLTTDTMIDHTTTDPFQFDLTSTSEIVLEYKDATWSIPKE